MGCTSVRYVMTCGWHEKIKHTHPVFSDIFIYLFVIWNYTIDKELFGMSESQHDDKSISKNLGGWNCPTGN